MLVLCCERRHGLLAPQPRRHSARTPSIMCCICCCSAFCMCMRFANRCCGTMQQLWMPFSGMAWELSLADTAAVMVRRFFIVQLRRQVQGGRAGQAPPCAIAAAAVAWRWRQDVGMPWVVQLPQVLQALARMQCPSVLCRPQEVPVGQGMGGVDASRRRRGARTRAGSRAMCHGGARCGRRGGRARDGAFAPARLNAFFLLQWTSTCRICEHKLWKHKSTMRCHPLSWRCIAICSCGRLVALSWPAAFGDARLLDSVFVLHAVPYVQRMHSSSAPTCWTGSNRRGKKSSVGSQKIS